MKTDILKKTYMLEKHPEGGWFSEVYTSNDDANGRSIAGSIYFLLDKEELSHFHRIDCDELWYFHEGCGLKITLVSKNGLEELFLGNDTEHGQRAMVLIPKGSVFAAENLDTGSYTFISCATAPKFTYDGFELLKEDDVLSIYPDLPRDVLKLAFK